MTKAPIKKAKNGTYYFVPILAMTQIVKRYRSIGADLKERNKIGVLQTFIDELAETEGKMPFKQ